MLNSYNRDQDKRRIQNGSNTHKKCEKVQLYTMKEKVKTI